MQAWTLPHSSLLPPAATYLLLLPYCYFPAAAAVAICSLKLKEMYQMITLGGDAELELVDTLDPFSEVRLSHSGGHVMQCGPGCSAGGVFLGVGMRGCVRQHCVYSRDRRALCTSGGARGLWEAFDPDQQAMTQAAAVVASMPLAANVAVPT
jgi:hypothetical protein